MNHNHDLRALAGEARWFFTAAIPAPSNQADSGHRFALEWRNARRQLSDDWDAEELARVDELVAGLDHGGGEALVVVHARSGSTLLEFLDEPVAATTIDEGPLPRLATLIEARRRAIPHVVVEVDRAGADLTAFDGGDVLATSAVQGDTLHIHRGHPGGWSQRRFQQRAENTWESNARDVADAVAALARRVDARLVAVAGDVRAQTFVLESLPSDLSERTVKIESGSPTGIAEDVVRLLSSLVATDVVAAADAVRNGLPQGTASIDPAEVLLALREGRVDTLLVHDDGSDAPLVGDTGAHGEDVAGARLADAAIVAALNTEAEIVVVPALAFMPGPIAAVMRW